MLVVPASRASLEMRDKEMLKERKDASGASKQRNIVW